MNKIIKFETINSTNTYLKEHYKSIDNKTIVYALEQTEGRGRLGRTWISNIGENIMCSILLKTSPFENPSVISLITGVAIHKVLSNYIKDIYIKWPNDLWVNDKKICGILCEMVEDNLIIGFGVNVNQISFDDNLRHPATSLKLINNKEYDIDSLTIEISNKILEEIDLFLNDKLSVMNYLNNHLYGKGKTVTYTINNNMRSNGVLTKIDEEGSLIIKTNKRFEKIISGEVDFK